MIGGSSFSRKDLLELYVKLDYSSACLSLLLQRSVQNQVVTEGDQQKVRELLEDFKVITLKDDDNPIDNNLRDRLSTLCPVVTLHKGSNLSIFRPSEKRKHYLIGFDSPKYANVFLKKGFSVGYLDTSSGGKTIIFKEAGDLCSKTAYIECNSSTDANYVLGCICDKILLTDPECNNNQLRAAATLGSKHKIWGLVGPSRSQINRLIKYGQIHFCDTWEDLLDDPTEPEERVIIELVPETRDGTEGE